jgi:hypothetical protein
MWNPLNLLGSSIFVEAAVKPRMEGNDATALIAARMGIDPTEVGSRLVSLHQKGELDGMADGTAADGQGTPARVEGGANNISLTSKNLEEFERSESEGMITGTPHKLTLKPSILGPKTPSIAAAPPPAAAASESEDSASVSKWHEDMETTTGDVDAVDADAVEPEEATTGADAVAPLAWQWSPRRIWLTGSAWR